MEETPTLHRLTRTAQWSVLVTPLLLLHAHGLAEGAIVIADLAFLARSTILRDWAWARSGWMRFAWAWWGWNVICSLPIPALSLGEGGRDSLIQGIVMVRFLIWVAALEHAILRPAEVRRWLYWMVAGSTIYIAVHSLFQYATGHNLYGAKNGPEGELTGPFSKPRAGAVYARMLLPAMVPAAMVFLRQPGNAGRIKATAVLIGGLAVSLLIGQRMPFILACFGMAIVALLQPKLRTGIIVAGIASAILLAASPIVAPKAYHRLVERFTTQMAHFAVSPYGELYARAWEVGVQNPLTGYGYEGFNKGCLNPDYFVPTWDGSIPDGGGAAACWHHPHQFYLEALDSGGFPGMFLFAALNLAWLVTLGRGLGSRATPLRAALFAAAMMQFWPIASTSAITSMPVNGWSYLLLGWGLAEVKWGEADDT
jgi:hypothetical protein